MDSGYSPSKFLPDQVPGLLPPFPSFNLEPMALQGYESTRLTNFHQDFTLKAPKPEPIESDQWIYQLPDLRLIEEDRTSNKNMNLPMIPASTKRVRSSLSTDSHTLQAIVQNHLPFQSQSQSPSPSQSQSPSPSPSVNPANELARKRRKTITEKTRSLAKLMPWEKKMHTATMLEEAHKYVQFLKAQVSVLQSMPYQSLIPPVGFEGGGGGSSFGGLEKLNRQQLLQVLLNSPVAQSVLASQGSCVYSMEQVLLLKKNLLEQMAFSGGSSIGHP